MKKRLTRGEKWLFASPFLFLLVAGVVWLRQKSAPYSIELPASTFYECAAFSPDNGKLVVFLRNLKTRKYIGYIVDLKTRTKVCELDVPLSAPKPLFLQAPSWSPDGERIAMSANIYSTSSRSNRILVWDATSGNLQMDRSYPKDESGSSLGNIIFSSDGKKLVGFGEAPEVLDAATGERQFDPAIEENWGIYGKPAAKRLGLEVTAKAKNNTVFRVVDAKTHQTLWNPRLTYINEHQAYRNIFVVQDRGLTNKNGLELQERLLLWDAENRTQLPSPPIPPKARIRNIRQNPVDSTIAYSLYYLNKLTEPLTEQFESVIWDYRANRVLWRSKGKDLRFYPSWSPDGNFLMMADILANSRLSVLDKSGKTRLERDSAFQDVVWSSDSKQIVTIESEYRNNIRIRDCRLEIHHIEEE